MCVCVLCVGERGRDGEPKNVRLCDIITVFTCTPGWWGLFIPAHHDELRARHIAAHGTPRPGGIIWSTGNIFVSFPSSSFPFVSRARFPPPPLPGPSSSPPLFPVVTIHVPIDDI